MQQITVRFSCLYASGRAGWADDVLEGPRKTYSLFNLIIEHVPEPKQINNTHEPFSMLATTLNADNYLGRLLTGRIESEY